MNKKLVVISGSSHGIGRAIAIKFASEGFIPVLNGRDAYDLEIVKEEIMDLYKIDSYLINADLSQKNEVKGMANFVLSLNVPIAALVNNAGVFIPSNILEEDDIVLEDMMDINLFAAYYLSKGLIPKMIEQNEGHIFNICSIASLDAYVSSTSYSITKFALLGFSKGLRKELMDKNIKVSAILPGATLTKSWDGAKLPPERFIQPEDVANVIWSAFTLSESSVVEEIVIRPQLGDI